MKSTISDWNDFRSTQLSGVMNMMGHPLILKFMPGDNYQKAKNHFEKDGNTTTLEIDH